VNLPQAESSLSQLVDDIEQGRAQEIILSRDGRPAAKLVPVEAVPTARRIG
jgi:antitoxin (DNA-binding transcriptional repressor) of toxin-antitoxin stability system